MKRMKRFENPMCAALIGLGLLVSSAACGRELSPEDLGPLLEGFVPAAIDGGDIAGAAVVVVKDGRILLERGYGYADLATRQPVDPERTLFRPGSIAKLFTWTAVMQLAEQGRIDLDRDV